MENEFEKILEKVFHLYRKYGVKSITMDDVARELGISKKTLYQYVEDKAQLVDKVVDFEIRRRESCHMMYTGKAENAIDELFAVNKSINRMLKEHNPSMEYDLKKYYPESYMKIQKKRHDGMYNSILQNIIKGKKEGYYRSDVNEKIIAKLYLSRVEGIIENDFFTVEEFTSPAVIREILTYHIRAIANEKGIKYFENNIKKFNIIENE